MRVAVVQASVATANPNQASFRRGFLAVPHLNWVMHAPQEARGMPLAHPQAGPLAGSGLY